MLFVEYAVDSKPDSVIGYSVPNTWRSSEGLLRNCCITATVYDVYQAPKNTIKYNAKLASSEIIQ